MGYAYTAYDAAGAAMGYVLADDDTLEPLHQRVENLAHGDRRVGTADNGWAGGGNYYYAGGYQFQGRYEESYAVTVEGVPLYNTHYLIYQHPGVGETVNAGSYIVPPGGTTSWLTPIRMGYKDSGHYSVIYGIAVAPSGTYIVPSETDPGTPPVPMYFWSNFFDYCTLNLYLNINGTVTLLYSRPPIAGGATGQYVTRASSMLYERESGTLHHCFAIRVTDYDDGGKVKAVFGKMDDEFDASPVWRIFTEPVGGGTLFPLGQSFDIPAEEEGQPPETKATYTKATTYTQEDSQFEGQGGGLIFG